MAKVEVGDVVAFYTPGAPQEALRARVLGVTEDGKRLGLEVIGPDEVAFPADNVPLVEEGERELSTQHARRFPVEGEAEEAPEGVEFLTPPEPRVDDPDADPDAGLSETSKAAKEAAIEEGAKFKAL